MIESIRRRPIWVWFFLLNLVLVIVLAGAFEVQQSRDETYLAHRQEVGNQRQTQNNTRFEATATCVTQLLTLVLTPPVNPPPSKATVRAEILADCADLIRIQPNKSAP